MSIAKTVVLLLSISAVTIPILAQAPSAAQAAGPTFDVVSIKLSPPRVPGAGYTFGVAERPDGGLRGTNVPAGVLIARAYPPGAPADVVGLPGWAMSEHYDVMATASLANPTPDERTAMLRAMLAERFHLAVHVEDRGQAVYDLVLARSDGRLGPGLTKSDLDCARILAERAAAPPSPPTPTDLSAFSAPPPPCTARSVGAPLRDRYGDRQGKLGDLLEGETTLDSLTNGGLLRSVVGRPVVNKTGLTGTYRIKMNFDTASSRSGPGIEPSTPAPAPSIFEAIQEQLGLKLQPSREPRPTLIVDHLERPTEN